MQVTETLTEGLKREFKVIVPAADIEKKIAEFGKRARDGQLKIE